MRQGEITFAAWSDPLIHKYGGLHFERVGSQRSYEVSAKMREMARLLLKLSTKYRKWVS